MRDYGEEGQLGLEPDFNDFLKKMWAIYDEIKRVLKKDGTVWINFGDTYSGSNTGHTGPPQSKWKTVPRGEGKSLQSQINLPSKCLCLIPERFALGMIDRGWILRNKVIWNKPNHMPSSVKDRFSNSWEYIYFFSKSRKYYFDLDAVREKHKESSRFIKTAGYHPPNTDKKTNNGDSTISGFGQKKDGWTDYISKYGRHPNPSGKNPGDVVQEQERLDPYANDEVHQRARTRMFWHQQYDGPNPLGKTPDDFWTITTQPFPEAHFAVFPEKLVERPIKTTPRWICNKCNKPRVRIVETTSNYKKREKAHCPNNADTKVDSTGWEPPEHHTTGWTKCDCNAGFHPAMVLDPFMGSGTTAVVAKKLGRNYIGIDISEKYCEMARKRIAKVPVRLDMIGVKT